MPTNKRLSDAELEIMQVLWSADAAVTSTHVLSALKGLRKWALSTLMTVLARLMEKGFLQCDRSTRVNLYSPLISAEEYSAMEGKSFLDRLCGSSLPNLVASLYNEKAIGAKEIDELRAFLDALGEEGRP